MQKSKVLAIFSLIALVILANGNSRTVSHIAAAATNPKQIKSTVQPPKIRQKDSTQTCDVDWCLKPGIPISNFEVSRCTGSDPATQVRCDLLNPQKLPPGAHFSSTVGNPAIGSLTWNDPEPPGLVFKLVIEATTVTCPSDTTCTDNSGVITVKVLDKDCKTLKDELTALDDQLTQKAGEEGSVEKLIEISDGIINAEPPLAVGLKATVRQAEIQYKAAKISDPDEKFFPTQLSHRQLNKAIKDLNDEESHLAALKNQLAQIKIDIKNLQNAIKAKKKELDDNHCQ